MRSTRTSIAAAFFVLFLGIAGTAGATAKEVYVAWDTVARAFCEIRSRHVDQIPDQVLVYAAVRGMVGALDPHSVFLDPDAYRRMMNEEKGRYFGVGVELDSTGSSLVVKAVLPEGPAMVAGVRPGDRITEINQTSIDGLTLDAASSLLVGARGSTVQMRILRDEGTLLVDMIRDWVHIPASWGTLLEPGLAHVVLAHFQQGAARELRATLRGLEDENKARLRGIVLDLRDNPGGLLDEAAEVVDVFVGDGPIVETQARRPGSEEKWRGHASDADQTDCQVVVLVNGGSASGSEIVAGALRDLRGDPIVGTATYGKGTVQSMISFEDGSAIKLTVGRYVLPRGETIQPEQGLIPDVISESPEDSAWRVTRDRLLRDVDEATTLPPAARASLKDAIEGHQRPPPRTRAYDLQPMSLTARLNGDPQLATALHVLTTRVQTGR